MLDYAITHPEGILVLKPHAPLSKADFAGLSTMADAYLSDHATIHGVLIQSKAFPGWEDFGGFTAWMHFMGEHHAKIRRVALVTDSRIAGMAETLGKHFTSAEIRHFAFADDAQAMLWLQTP